jgi:ribosomal protein S17
VMDCIETSLQNPKDLFKASASRSEFQAHDNCGQHKFGEVVEKPWNILEPVRVLKA